MTAAEKQSSKTTGSTGCMGLSPGCPTRHAMSPVQGRPFSLAGREATRSLIMNPRGLVLPLATGAKTVHPGSSPHEEHLQATGLNK